MARIEPIDATDGKDAVAKWQAAAAAASSNTRDEGRDAQSRAATPVPTTTAAAPAQPEITTISEAKELVDQLGWHPNFFDTARKTASPKLAADAMPYDDPWVRN